MAVNNRFVLLLFKTSLVIFKFGNRKGGVFVYLWLSVFLCLALTPRIFCSHSIILVILNWEYPPCSRPSFSNFTEMSNERMTCVLHLTHCSKSSKISLEQNILNSVVRIISNNTNLFIILSDKGLKTLNGID